MTADNPVLRETAVMLERAGKKEHAQVWLLASKMLRRPGANKVEVNVGRLARVSDGDPVFVPGKVLGTGIVMSKVVVGAFSFSGAARTKISAAGGSAMSIREFVKAYPKGSGVKIVE